MNVYNFLPDAKGVILVGSAKGNERKLFSRYDLNVIFVEAIPAVYEICKTKIGGLVKAGKNYVALNGLVTDKDDQPYEFKVSSNRGLSSSIYELKDHKKIWGKVSMVSTIQLKSVTLPTLLERNGLDVKNYDALVMDTQGSEILVLRGAEKIISNFNYIMTEVADFEAYEGCGQLKDIEEYMKGNGFVELYRCLQVAKKGVGSYYDILYKKR